MSRTSRGTCEPVSENVEMHSECPAPVITTDCVTEVDNAVVSCQLQTSHTTTRRTDVTASHSRCHGEMMAPCWASTVEQSALPGLEV